MTMANTPSLNDSSLCFGIVSPIANGRLGLPTDPVGLGGVAGDTTLTPAPLCVFGELDEMVKLSRASQSGVYIKSPAARWTHRCLNS